MRRINYFLGVAAIAGLVFALALPPGSAYAKKATTTTTGSTCGSDGKDQNGNPCNCPPHYAFIAFGNGEAIDYLNQTTYIGCYDPSTAPDPNVPNDDSFLTCPPNLGCGCVLAGSEVPGGTDVPITGDTDLGNWKLTKLELNFAYLEFSPTDDFIGDPVGSGSGENGGRCYGAAGFADIVSTGGGNGLIPAGQEAELLLQGLICDSIPRSSAGPPVPPQQFSFNGTYTFDPLSSSTSLIGFTGAGNFVASLNNVSTNPNEFQPTNFSIDGYLLP